MHLPKHIPILYLILAVLVLVGVVPLYIYGNKVVAIYRDPLKTNEKLLQNTVTRSLADGIDQRQGNLRTMLENLTSAVEISSGGNLSIGHVDAPEMRALLEKFVSSSDNIVYASLLNGEAKGISAGRAVPDAFMQRELEHGFNAAREGRSYNGQAMIIGSGKDARTARLVSTPIMVNKSFIGMVAAVVDLQFLVDRLKDASQGGMVLYVVDHQGRMIAGATSEFATGQDMRKIEIVNDFVENGLRIPGAVTKEFKLDHDGKKINLLGTYSGVPSLEWAVVAQKPTDLAYQAMNEMQRTAQILEAIAVVLSIAISIFAARRITSPLETLTASSRAIAKGDFSHRVTLHSRTEIGELADTFNTMSSDLERFVFDLKNAAEQNRALFMGSIQMLAGAVDEKDPYTRGHSDRVTRYSVLLAEEMALLTEEIERIRVAAQLHDVGKIGIEDRILKKPGALTPDEFEIMKTHTTKGANILRPVEMLRDMLPGIELHHESLDGRGYPHGLKGDQLPMLPRVIMVADTFDAMTTNRPYQAAMDPEYVIRIIHSLINSKFDPRVVLALQSLFERGALRLHRAAVLSGAESAAAPAPAAAAAEAAPKA